MAFHHSNRKVSSIGCLAFWKWIPWCELHGWVAEHRNRDTLTPVVYLTVRNAQKINLNKAEVISKNKQAHKTKTKKKKTVTEVVINVKVHAFLSLDLSGTSGELSEPRRSYLSLLVAMSRLHGAVDLVDVKSLGRASRSLLQTHHNRCPAIWCLHEGGLGIREIKTEIRLHVWPWVSCGSLASVPLSRVWTVRISLDLQGTWGQENSAHESAPCYTGQDTIPFAEPRKLT